MSALRKPVAEIVVFWRNADLGEVLFIVKLFIFREVIVFCVKIRYTITGNLPQSERNSTEINAPRGRTLSGRQWFCADRNEV